MLSKRTEPRSIAAQLVLLFTPASALLLCSGLAVFYLLVVRHAFEEDNRALHEKLIALRAELGGPGGIDPVVNQLKVVRGGEHIDYWVRLLDSSGHILAETPGMEKLLEQSIFSRTDASAMVGAPKKKYRAAGKLFSLATTTLDTAGRRIAIQVAQDRSADEQFTREFAALLAVVVVIGVVASAAIATTVAKRGLRPLLQMADSLNRIGPTRLSERVTPTGWPRELRPLASAFDEMLVRLEESFRRLSQFSADIAHELRTPVGNILGESQVALTRGRTTDEYREVIESSVAECDRLSKIIDNLLFLARAEAAEGHIQTTTFEGKAAIGKIATLYETIAEERQITLRCIGRGDVYADDTLFGRVISNLVENALHHTRPGGTISISVETSPNESRIAVSDTGCGIAAEHISRVFDRFYCADPSRTSKGGAGLGLALVKSIAELHGGSARISSEVGRGTTVTVTFPSKPMGADNSKTEIPLAKRTG